MKPAWTILVLTLAAGAALLGHAAFAAPEAKTPALRLELFANDLAASRDFYRDVLGFSVEREEKEYIVVRLGDIQIGLGSATGLSARHYFNPELQSQRRGLGVEIVLEVQDLDAAFQRVDARHVKVLSKIQKRPWGARDFRIADPDGYYLRLTAD